MASSCVKEGPMGPEGAAGADGADGKDANETCITCHAPSVVDAVTVQFQLSKHGYGEAAFEEAGNTTCAPCHASEGLKYVITNNIPATFTLPAGATRYVNNYITSAGAAYGEIGCGACHSSIHKTYAKSDLPALTTTAAVPLTMWGGLKTVDLKADGGSSNLCVRCHQPRPQTHLQTGNVQDWVTIAANPKAIAYDANNNSATTNIVRPAWRLHIHYGSVGAIYAGIGGVEFAGSMQYPTTSAHASLASCADCHMGKGMVGRAGGHSFTAKGNLTTCNATGCHTTPINSSNSTYWVNPRTEIKKLLDDLAAKLTVAGVDIMSRNRDAEHNLWYGLTTNNYDGYVNVLDMQNNPDGKLYNTTLFQNPSAPSAPNQYWSQADLDYNKTLPKLNLTNGQYGALINFQMCLRDYSLGIHNFQYTKALLTNSIAVL